MGAHGLGIIRLIVHVSLIPDMKTICKVKLSSLTEHMTYDVEDAAPPGKLKN